MMKSLENFVDSENESFQAYGAFQIIILARVIVDVDQVIFMRFSTKQCIWILVRYGWKAIDHNKERSTNCTRCIVFIKSHFEIIFMLNCIFASR